MSEMYHGFDIVTVSDPIGFRLGETSFSHGTEVRKLDAIRKSLMQPDCEGPEDVYNIMMDVGNRADEADLNARHLLFGAVCYAKGMLGQEPVRSQGHIHKLSPLCGMSTPEVYEIWQGRAAIYMQEYGDDDPGRCFAVIGEAGDVVVVPPGWTHATVNADHRSNMSFGAWCDREYGFVYDKVRSHGGIAFFPVFRDGELVWQKNPAYKDCEIVVKRPSDYSALGIERGVPIYTQYREHRSRFGFVTDPASARDVWKNFVP